MEKVYAIGYARISDEIQLKGDGLTNQCQAIISFIDRNKWTLFPKGKVLEEVFTGSTKYRPTYQKILSLIKENPNKIKYFVIARIDRMSREGSEVYLQMKSELADLGVELRDTQGIIQPSTNTLAHRGIGFKWSEFTPSRLAEIITTEGAKSERVSILSRTMDTSVARVETGYKLRESHFGFRNQKVVGEDGKEKTIQVRDEKEAPWIEAIFEKTLIGTPDQEIADYVNSLGYKSRPRKKWQGKRENKRIIGVVDGIQLEVINPTFK